MAKRTTTVIIEPHLLVREALESLIKNYRYRVIRSVGSAADIDDWTTGEDPKLVILGADSTDAAIAEAVSIRKRWAGSKIVLLFEHASVADFQKLLTSEVDGCVPLFASPETLIRTLDLVTIEDARVVVTANTKSPAVQPTPSSKTHPQQIKTDGIPSGNGEHGTRAINGASIAVKPVMTSGDTGESNGQESDVHWTAAVPNGPRLSEREAQILDGLVQGHANKVIARTCDITEATVKVHMKSILRKIQVANRTQAAVWALEHGHSACQMKNAC
jgi:two-component system, NarL family, nitrate/nitrite response regulator NarL